MVRNHRKPNCWKAPENPELADPGAALFRKAKAAERAKRREDREQRRAEKTRKAQDVAEWQRIRAAVIAHYGKCPCGVTVGLLARRRVNAPWNSGLPEHYECVCPACFHEQPAASDEATEEFRQMFG